MTPSRSTASASRPLLRSAFTVAIALLALAGLTGSALAERLVILDFTGPRAKRVQRQVAEVLKRDHELVAHRQYMRAARKLRAAKPTDENVKKVAARLEADGILIGTVTRRRGQFEIAIKVRSAATGEIVHEAELTTRRIPLRRAGQQALREKLEEGIIALAEARIAFEPAPEEAPAPAPADAPPAVDEEPEQDEARPSSLLTDAERADRAVRGRAVEVQLDGTLLLRTLDFDTAEGLGAAGPRGYESDPVPGVAIAGALYPMAFGDGGGFLRNLGVTAAFDRILTIQSRLRYGQTEPRMVAELPTEQSHWGAGVVYRHNFGSSPTSPTLRVGIRYNQLRFDIDKTMAPTGVEVDIPNMDYSYIDPGLGVRVPLSGSLAVDAAARVLLVLDVGEMQDADQYGSASITGYEADLTLTYRLAGQLSLRAGAAWRQFGFDFDGDGPLTTDRDGDPDTQDVGGATDRYLGGYAGVGYGF